jgi:hypothetical protein
MRALSASRGRDQPQAAGLAKAVVGEYGRRLAHLIATLTQPRDAGDAGAACADVLPLIGAARSRSTARSGTVVLDFGHTSVKRAVATMADHRLVRLDLLPSVAVQMSEQIVPFMLDVVADTLNTARQRFGSADVVVVVSVASYVIGSRPVAAGASRYLPLSETDSAALDDELVRRTDQPVHICFVHDGTAAARGLIDPGHRAAVIMLGTTLGVGFAPAAAGLLRVSSELVVARAESGSAGGVNGD